MAKNNDFKVYQGSYIPGDGAPLIIISACSDNRKLYSEYFIFVQDSEKSFYTQSMSCKEGEISTGIKLDINFMMNYALESAKAKLNDHLYQKYKKTQERAYLYNQYELSETDPSTLVCLYMRAQYNDQLEAILKERKMCPELCKFLNGLTSLPKIIIGD